MTDTIPKSTPDAGPTSAFYGWKMVAALFVMLAFTSGLGFYNHAVMLTSLTTELGFSVSVASSAISAFFIATGLSGPLIALLIERYDVRWTICAGAVLAGAALAAIGHVETRLELFAVYICFGVGFAASGLLPATTLVSRWFRKRRAMALSIASTGLSIGGVVVTPAAAFVIATFGIGSASPMMGIVYLLGVVPLALLFVRSDPADLGLGMDGDAYNEEAAAHDGVAFRDAIRIAYFWSLAIAYVFVMAAQVGGIAHQYGVVGQQLSGQSAAIALGVLPLFSIIGRLLGGYLIDRLSMRLFTLGMMLLQGLSLFMVGVSDTAAGLIIGLALFGVTVGNLLMLQPLLIAEAFGLRHYPQIYSVSNLLTMLGVAAGPAMMGLVFEVTGAYFYSYVCAAVSGIIALAIYVAIPPMVQLTAEDPGATPEGTG